MAVPGAPVALAKCSGDAHHSRVSFVPSCLDASLPLVSDNSKRFCRHTSQDVCPWNVRFSRDVTEPRLRPRADRVDPDAAELLALSDFE